MTLTMLPDDLTILIPGFAQVDQLLLQLVVPIPAARAVADVIVASDGQGEGSQRCIGEREDKT